MPHRFPIAPEWKGVLSLPAVTKARGSLDVVVQRGEVAGRKARRDGGWSATGASRTDEGIAPVVDSSDPGEGSLLDGQRRPDVPTRPWPRPARSPRGDRVP